MSVSGSPGGYESVDVQSFYDEFSVAAADLDGTTGQGGGQAFHDDDRILREPAEGIPRGATAELVAVLMHMDVFQNSTTTADGTVLAALEWSSSGTPEIADADGISTAIGNAGTVDLVDLVHTADSDVLFIQAAVGHAPFFDSTNGVGGAGHVGTSVWEVNYRNEFGSGPVFERDDEVHGHIAFKQWNIADAAIHALVRGQMYWDVTIP